MLHKKTILQQTAQVGSSTLMSRLLGLIREVLMTRYLGSGVLADSFFTAYKIPNMLRKIFAEGALSAAFIPTLVKVGRENKTQVSSLITLGFLVFETFLVLLCIIVMICAKWVLWIIAPGFSPEQIAYTIPYVRILMPFILLVSSSALLGGALQATGHFFIPAFAPVLLNIIYIFGLVICTLYSLNVEYLCYFIMAGGVLQLLLHLYAYFKLNFSFTHITDKAVDSFYNILIKFVPCFFTLSVTEVSVFISTSLASYESGAIGLIYYAFRFMQIPMGVFASAFSTILLPHFTRVGSYAPKRLSFYLLETTKFVFWVTIPATILMIFFSQKIFLTIFLSNKFTLDDAIKCGYILNAFSMGLFFFSLNKILLNIYYALHVTWIPTVIGLVVALLNVLFDFMLIKNWHATGLAFATTLSVGMIQTILLTICLFARFNFKSYLKNFAQFVMYYSMQLSVVLFLAYGVYKLIESNIARLHPQLANFFLYSIGYWLWTGPLCVAIVAVLYYLRNLFKVELYFLNDL